MNSEDPYNTQLFEIGPNGTLTEIDGRDFVSKKSFRRFNDTLDEGKDINFFLAGT